jgi:hypothetical protein
MGGKVKPLPTDGNISALNVPHSSMVFDLHDSIDVTAELLDSEGVATETIRYANIVSFVCLKVLAFDHRAERKDAHDLVYCIEHGPGSWEAAAAAFREQMGGKHSDVIPTCVGLLRKHFAGNDQTEGYQQNGPVKVANFELGESEDRENRIIRQRRVADTMEAFLGAIEAAKDEQSASLSVTQPSPRKESQS